MVILFCSQLTTDNPVLQSKNHSIFGVVERSSGKPLLIGEPEHSSWTQTDDAGLRLRVVDQAPDVVIRHLEAPWRQIDRLERGLVSSSKATPGFLLFPLRSHEV